MVERNGIRLLNLEVSFPQILEIADDHHIRAKAAVVEQRAKAAHTGCKLDDGMVVEVEVQAVMVVVEAVSLLEDDGPFSSSFLTRT